VGRSNSNYGLSEPLIQLFQNILFVFNLDLIITGSWDKSIKLWDPRQRQCTGTYAQPEMVCTCNDSSLIVQILYEWNKIQQIHSHAVAVLYVQPVTVYNYTL
jgi:WD40 repeat protein